MDFSVAQSPAGRTIEDACYGLDMLVALPKYAASDDQRDLPSVVKNACLESWLMHARLLVDFFLPPPPEKRDRRNIYIDVVDSRWQYPSDDRRARLLQFHKLASNWVAHLTKDRVTWEGEPQDRSRAALESVVTDMLDVIAQFCKEARPATTEAEQIVSYLQMNLNMAMERRRSA